MIRPRYASAQDAARAAAEAAQIIKRNEAQNAEQRDVWHHARAEFDRLTSLEPTKAEEPRYGFVPAAEMFVHRSSLEGSTHSEHEPVLQPNGLHSIPAGCPIGPETQAE